MNAKHQFKYTYSDTELEEFSPVEVTFDMPGDVTITQMLYNFESYLKACGFYFDGHLEIVDDTLKDLDLIDELQGGCMADFDKECGCSGAVGAKGKEGVAGSSCDGSCEGACEEYKNKKLKEWSEGKFSPLKEKREKFLKEWDEGIARLDSEQKQKCREEALKMSDLHYEATKEVKKNKWFHGICNPPSPDWKKNK